MTMTPHTNDLFIAANWKMNLDVRQSINVARSLRDKISTVHGERQLWPVVCPSFEALVPVGEILSGTNIQIGAQDVFWQERGAYTGEIAASMLVAAGCSYVIIGHSERRRYLGENDEMVNRKIRVSLAAGLTPIICVGETFEERSAGMTDHVLMRQVIEGLKGIPLSKTSSIIIAYEPVWVIGTGQAIEPQMAQRSAQIIHQSLIDLMPQSIVEEQTRIIYGGSVSAENVHGYVSTGLLEGALVGGASLSATKFINLLSSL